MNAKFFLVICFGVLATSISLADEPISWHPDRHDNTFVSEPVRGAPIRDPITEPVTEPIAGPVVPVPVRPIGPEPVRPPIWGPVRIRPEPLPPCPERGRELASVRPEHCILRPVAPRPPILPRPISFKANDHAPEQQSGASR
jgi:hypothetical protein